MRAREFLFPILKYWFLGYLEAFVFFFWLQKGKLLLHHHHPPHFGVNSSTSFKCPKKKDLLKQFFSPTLLEDSNPKGRNSTKSGTSNQIQISVLSVALISATVDTRLGVIELDPCQGNGVFEKENLRLFFLDP